VDRFVWSAGTSSLAFELNLIRLRSFQNEGNAGNPAQVQGNHKGGGIHFGPGGKLYVIGDNGRRGWSAPDDAHLTGVPVRINPDGPTPPTTPSPTTATSSRPRC
jgi:glucose/arabinose dehydrogenase